MIDWLYRAAWVVAAPLARAAARGESKLARSVRGRLAAAPVLAAWARSSRDTGRPLVWFHAASVGEGRQAEAVLHELRRLRPAWQLAYTFASASAERLAASLPVDVSGYLPPDTPRDTSAVLAALRPAALVFSATDVWPELVRQAAALGVRTALVSANLAQTSSRRGILARALLHAAYTALDRVGAIDERDAALLRELGVRPGSIVVTGDSRHDAAAARAAQDAASRRALLGAIGSGGPTLVAGSTWDSDVRELLPAVAAVRSRGPLRLVIAPHEPSRAALARLERQLVARLPGAAVRRLSGLERQPGAWDVCVVDRVGVLFDLYALATAAYVGGGFHRAGLHSVIEPAAFGVPVVCGPRWHTSRDARLLLESGGAAAGTDAAGLARPLEQWLHDTAARAAAGAAARAVVDRGVGAAGRSAALVIELVERPNG